MPKPGTKKWTLDEGAVSKILARQESRKQVDAISKSMRLLLAVSVKHEKDTFRYQGSKFIIRYEPEVVFVRPEEGFAPGGWFNRKALQDFLDQQDL